MRIENPIIAQEGSDLISPNLDYKIIRKETNLIFFLGFPVSVGYLMQNSLGLASVVCVGRLGKTELAASALATMFSNVTGFSVALGMSSALDTLCAQAHTGNPDKYAAGKHLQRSIVVMCFLTLLTAILWVFTEPILLFFGQDPTISKMSAQYLIYLIPGIFPYFAFECLKRYLQSQNIMNGTWFVICLVTPLNILFQWLFIFVFGFGFKGAAIATSITYTLLPILLLFYIRYLSECEAWSGWDRREAFNLPLLWEFLALGIPGVGMVCSEWWAFEIAALAAGILGEEFLAAQSIILNTCGMAYMLPLGVSIAAAARIGNNLGYDCPNRARQSAVASLVVGAVFSLFNCLFFFTVKDFWGMLFVNDSNVQQIISHVLPLGALFELSDGLNCVGGGILRGCGQQRIGAIINFTGYYCLGIPIGLYCAFSLKLGLLGLWIGLATALILVSIVEVTIILRLDWQLQAQKARDRLAKEEEETLLSDES